MLLVLAVAALAVWLLAAGAVRVMTRYRHSTRSKAALWGLVAFAASGGYWITSTYFSAVEGTRYFWPLAAFLSIPCYIVFAVVLTEIWRFSIQVSYERKIYLLSEDEARYQEEIDILRRSGYPRVVSREESRSGSSRSSRTQELRNRVNSGNRRVVALG